MTPTGLAVYIGFVWVALISLVGVIIIYGFLTPWWKSRTGIGFMSTKVAFAALIGLTLARFYGYHIPVWLGYAGWLFMILAINLGITWNIIYKQFFQHRGDEVSDKSPHLKQEGVRSDVLTGEIPIQQGDRDDRGIPR
jgi:hypothetical protein